MRRASFLDHRPHFRKEVHSPQSTVHSLEERSTVHRKKDFTMDYGLWTIALFSVPCFLFSVILVGCAEKPLERKPAKTPVRVAQVKRDTLKETLFYVGDIKAQDQIEVYPRVAGKLIENTVKEGDRVEKDAIVAYIDRDEVGFEFERAPVTSPIEGIVGKVYLDKGARASADIAVAKVVNMDVVKVRVDVIERELPRVKVGQAAQVVVDAYSGEEFVGEVERVSPLVDLISRTALVEIRIPNPDHRLKAGMFCRMKITIGERKDVLAIPRDAIIRQDSSNYVFVVEDGGRVRRRKIETGLCEDNKFEVRGGLNEGELVVTMGNARLKDGDVVEVVK